MTTKHVLEGLMQWTKSRTHAQCAVALGLDNGKVSRIHSGKQTGMNMATVDMIQQRCGVPLETLFAWYRLPEGAVLGRVIKK